jgi:hypothetical protein
MSNYPHWSPKYRWKIPDDWDGETWDCCLLFWPESPQWKAIVRGTLEHLARGRSWDETTGSILDVQAIAKLIPLTFDPSPETKQIPEVQDVMACFDELVTQVTRIADLMESQPASPDYSAQLEALDALAGLAQLVGALEPEILYLYYGVKALAEVAGPVDLPALPSGE